MEQLQYFYNVNEGLWGAKLRRRGLSYPVLQYAEGTPENNFSMPLKLEDIGESYPIDGEAHTKKAPVYVKNAHREFWGLKPLRISPGATIEFFDAEEKPEGDKMPATAITYYRKACKKYGDSKLSAGPVDLYMEKVRAFVFFARRSLESMVIGWRVVAFLKSNPPTSRRFKKVS